MEKKIWSIKEIQDFYPDGSGKHPMDQKQIHIKGFVLQDANGKWMLCSHPDVKSCCIGNLSRENEQIFLEGLNLKPSGAQVFHLKGKLVHHNARPTPPKGEKYILKEAMLVPPKVILPPYYLMGWMGLLLIFLYLGIRTQVMFKTQVSTYFRHSCLFRCKGAKVNDK